MRDGEQAEQIAPGTAVIGVDGVPIGTVESATQEGIRVAGHAVPTAAIERVTADAVHLRLAKAAFEAHQDVER